MKKYFIFLLINIVTFNSSHAIELDNALKNLLSNNSDLKLEKSRLEQVKATKGDALSEFLPDIKASYQKGRQKNDALATDRGDLDKMNDQDVKQLSINQPLFKGFQGYNHAKEINYNIKSAEYYYQSKKNDIILAAIASYLNLLKTREALKLKNENYDNVARLLKLIEQRNVLGKIGGDELIKYQAMLSSTISEKLNAQKELFKAEEEYNKFFGQIDADLFLPIINQEEIPTNGDELQKLTMLHNANLKNYHFKIKSSESAVNRSRGKFSPQVDLYASVSEQENVTYLNDSDLRSEAIYLNVSVPIFQKGLEYVGVNKANKNLNFAHEEYQINKENIIKDLNQTFKEYLFYSDLLKTHDELTKLTQNRIQKIDQQVQIGRGDIINSYEAKLELNKILDEGLSHKIDHILSYYKLKIITGKLKL